MFFFRFFNFSYLKIHFFGRNCPKKRSSQNVFDTFFKQKVGNQPKASKRIQNHPKSGKNHFFFGVPNRPGMGFLTFLMGKEHDFRCFWMIFDLFWIVLVGFQVLLEPQKWTCWHIFDLIWMVFDGFLPIFVKNRWKKLKKRPSGPVMVPRCF